MGNEHFLATSLDLSGQQSIPVRLSVLGSYDEATGSSITQTGPPAALASQPSWSEAHWCFFSHTFTRPLGSLVGGVRALSAATSIIPVDLPGAPKAARAHPAFDRMRASLLKTQHDLLESEQLRHHSAHGLAQSRTIFAILGGNCRQLRVPL